MMSPSRRPVGRRPLTDRRAILTAAREIGVTHITVDAVASRVGIRHATLYRYFPSVQALTAALVNELCDEVALPEPGGRWQDGVRELCAALAATLDRYPGTVLAILQLDAVPQRVVVVRQALIDVLVRGGFTDAQAILGATTALEIVGASAIDACRREGIHGSDECASPRAALKVELLILGLENLLGRDDRS